MFLASDLHFEGLKYDKIAKYLGKMMTGNEILEENMEEILHIKEGKMEEKQKKKAAKTLNTKKSGGNIPNIINSGGTPLVVTIDNSRGVGGEKTLGTRKSGGNILKNISSGGSTLVATTNTSKGVNKRKKKVTKNIKKANQGKLKKIRKLRSKSRKKIILGPKR